ncbi:MAG: hypothetical protein LLG06_09380 [Desulfobacteraceae bacterium]|nr:hypothetical protein [Desulfobacteraceae bacterium]
MRESGSIRVDEQTGTGTTREEQPAVSSGSAFQGLCSTCNSSSFCNFRRDTQQPVLFCEEFDSTVATIRLVPQIAKRSVVQDPIAGTNGRMGLCINCDKNEECTFRGSEGGVWHCEEYE